MSNPVVTSLSNLVLSSDIAADAVASICFSNSPETEGPIVSISFPLYKASRNSAQVQTTMTLPTGTDLGVEITLNGAYTVLASSADGGYVSVSPSSAAGNSGDVLSFALASKIATTNGPEIKFDIQPNPLPSPLPMPLATYSFYPATE